MKCSNFFACSGTYRSYFVWKIITIKILLIIIFFYHHVHQLNCSKFDKSFFKKDQSKDLKAILKLEIHMLLTEKVFSKKNLNYDEKGIVWYGPKFHGNLHTVKFLININ